MSTIDKTTVREDAVVLDYTNWKGERSMRTIVPCFIRFGSNEWHPEPQWLLEAVDLEKDQGRTFSLAGIHGVRSVGASPPAEPPPEDSPRDRSRVINEVLCYLHRVPSEDLSRLPTGKPSEDRDIFEPFDLTLTDETLSPFHFADRHAGRVFFYRSYDPDRVLDRIETTYAWRPGHEIESDGESWRLVSGRPDFRQGCWCMKWLARREERP